MKIKKPSLGFPCCFRKVLLFCASVLKTCAPFIAGAITGGIVEKGTLIFSFRV